MTFGYYSLGKLKDFSFKILSFKDYFDLACLVVGKHNIRYNLWNFFRYIREDRLIKHGWTWKAEKKPKQVEHHGKMCTNRAGDKLVRAVLLKNTIRMKVDYCSSQCYSLCWTQLNGCLYVLGRENHLKVPWHW